MPYRVEFAPAGERTFRRLPAQVQSRLVAPIEMLAQAPRPVGARKVVGQIDTWRMRVGEYRVVYEVNDSAERVIIIQVTRRSETTYRGR